MNVAENFFEYDEAEVLTNRGTSRVWRIEKGGMTAIKRCVTKEEAEIYQRLKGLNIKHIPEIYAIVECEENTYVFEEDIDGINLREFLKGGCCFEEKAKGIILQLCDVLAALHREKIVHRDIKPENIILSGGTVYLIDFNISRFHKENQSTDTEYLGTAGYAAPESFGFGQSDERSDIYSLGILFNELLTDKVSNQKISSGKYEAIIKKCVEIDPEMRYPNISSFKTALLGLSDKMKKEIKEEFDEINNTDRIFCTVFQWWTALAFCTAYIYNCIDSKWSLGFDYFAQTARSYLGSSYVHEGFLKFLYSIPSTGWMKMIVLAGVLIFFFKLLKERSLLSGVCLIGFFVYDLQWQITGFLNNSSIYKIGSPICKLDIINVILHILSIGVIIKILYNKKKIQNLKNEYKSL